MKRQNMYLGLIFALFLLLPGPLLAQEKSDDTDPAIQLEEVVVTAHRYEEPIKEVNANITVIDSQEIRMSPARNLGELLEEENIGHIEKTPGCSTSVGIRGFRTNTTGNDLMGNVLILLNGRRSGTGNVAKLMTDNIERIEIVRGPASVLYGSAAVGGVVNVITRQGEGKPSFYAEGKLGSFDYEEAGAGFSGEVAGFDFSGAASRSTMGDYETGDGEEYKNTGYDEEENVSLNLGYEFMPNNRIGLIYTSFDADEVGSPNYLSKNDLDDYVDNSNESVDLVYDGATSDGLFNWKAKYFFGKDEYRFMDPVESNPDFWDDGKPDTTDTDFKGAQAQISWNPAQYKLTAGFDWIKYEIEQEPYKPNKTEYDNPSYFLLGKARYLDSRLILTGGLRYDEYEVEMKEGQGGSESDDHVTPRIGAAYFILDDLKLRANYAQGFRMPSARELAGNYIIGVTPYKGNPNLDPEKSDTYEAGLDWYYKALNASLTYFYTDFEDKIQMDPPETPGGDTTWENLGEATVSGFEGKFSYDIATLWNLDWKIQPYINFTYHTEYENEITGEDLPYVSDLLLSYGLSVSDFEGFSLRLNFTYTGEQNIEDFESGYPALVVEKDSFTVADLTIEKRIIDFSDYGDLTLRGEVKNLFDKDYSYTKGYPMPGRNFAISLKYTF